MQEFVAELQTQAERVRDELAGLKQYVTDLETKSSERAAALSVAVSDLAKKRAHLQDQRKEQVAKMRVEAQKLLEPLNTLVLDMQEHRKESTAAQNRVQQAVFSLDEARRQEENQEQEMRSKLRSISGSITQSADQLRLVGSVGSSVRVGAQAQTARRPSQEASSPSRSVTAYPPGNSLSPTVTAALPGYSARR
jgi:predicted  nucleic acid-binding Zn-ribbon protein